MALLQIRRMKSVLKFAFSNATETRISGPIPFLTQHPRFYGQKRAAAETAKNGDLNETGDGKNLKRGAVAAWTTQAKAALQEYFLSTRNLAFHDAKFLVYNSPTFVKKLLGNIDDKEEDIGRALRRYFRYHPINEFEPFFESLGLTPSEYGPLLPSGMLCLHEDALLMENYHTLINYGVSSNKIGNILMEGKEVFRYDYGVLRTKLAGFERLGLSRSTVCKLAVSSPSLLIGDIRSSDFVKVSDKLKSLGFDFSWIDGQLSDRSSYNWGHIHELLFLFSKMVSSEELGELINQHPELLFYSSGEWTLLLIGCLLKFGFTVNQIHSLLLQFPEIHIEKFVSNLKHSFLFLNSAGMESEEIVKIVRSHPHMLGSCQLRSCGRLMRDLKASRKRLCSYIKENPLELKNWGMGSRPKPLPKSEAEIMEERQKAKFLSEMDLDEISSYRKGTFTKISCRDLQERFDVLVKAGLDRKDVSRMVRSRPRLLMRSKDNIQMKIDYLVNNLGYPASTLLTYPMYLLLSNQRTKLRMEMYNWLKEEQAVNPDLSVASLIGTSEGYFVKWIVDIHPRGHEVWEDLKKKIYPE